MASVKHRTLAANVVENMTFGLDGAAVEVCNVDGAAAVYFTVDGTDPTVAGEDCYVVAAGTGLALEVAAPAGGAGTNVRLISTGTPKVAITLITEP